MIGNNVGAAPTSRFRGDPYACFDRLPAPIRAALHEAVVAWSPNDVRWELNDLLRDGMSEAEAVAACVHAIRDADEGEVKTFAHLWLARFGRHSPHWNAQATIQRYGARAPA